MKSGLQEICYTGQSPLRLNSLFTYTKKKADDPFIYITYDEYDGNATESDEYSKNFYEDK